MKKILFLSCASAVAISIAILTVVSLSGQTGIHEPVIPHMPAAPALAPNIPNIPTGPALAPNIPNVPAAPEPNIANVPAAAAPVTIQRTPSPEPAEQHHYHAHQVEGNESPSVAPTESPRISFPSRNPPTYQEAEPRNAPAEARVGERFPQTRTSQITKEEAAAMSYEELHYALNEMYARHGFDFRDHPAFAKRFRPFNWYQPREGVSQKDIEREFSEVEYANEQVLGWYRDRRWEAGER